MRLAFSTCLLAALTACTSDTDYRQTSLQDAQMIIARPSSRIITERPRRVGPTSTQVLCTEPSPDVAIALARSGSVSGSGSVPQGPSVNLSGGYNSSETVTALKGRTAGVIALRDGLYYACQGYVNGVLGQDSYAIILSQYGKLLKELVGAGSDEGPSTAPASPAAAAASGSGVVVTVAGGSMTTPRQPAAPPEKKPADKPKPSPDNPFDALFLVACITEFDPTRAAPLNQQQQPILNPLLEKRCPIFMDGLLKRAAAP